MHAYFSHIKVKTTTKAIERKWTHLRLIAEIAKLQIILPSFLWTFYMNIALVFWEDCKKDNHY